MQVKICGLTHPEQAQQCVAAGADAIGMVFYPPSPRNLDTIQAREIALAVEGVARIGVFVNSTLEQIQKIAANVPLDWIQLHGQEKEELAMDLQDAGFRVIKALSLPPQDAQCGAAADAVLLESAKGSLPGGNGIAWNWAAAEQYHQSRADFNAKPWVLAGGLNCTNIEEALAKAKPDAVDLCTGVEKKAGVKDLDKVREFIEKAKNLAASTQSPKTPTRKLF